MCEVLHLKEENNNVPKNSNCAKLQQNLVAEQCRTSAEAFLLSWVDRKCARTRNQDYCLIYETEKRGT